MADVDRWLEGDDDAVGSQRANGITGPGGRRRLDETATLARRPRRATLCPSADPQASDPQPSGRLVADRRPQIRFHA